MCLNYKISCYICDSEIDHISCSTCLLHAYDTPVVILLFCTIVKTYLNA